jgi:hypothetical protein
LFTLIEINSALSSDDDDEDELDVLVFPFWPARFCGFDACAAAAADGI